MLLPTDLSVLFNGAYSQMDPTTTGSTVTIDYRTNDGFDSLVVLDRPDRVIDCDKAITLLGQYGYFQGAVGVKGNRVWFYGTQTHDGYGEPVTPLPFVLLRYL